VARPSRHPSSRETSATDSSLATKSFGSSPSFVYPDPGPLLANQGLTALKFAAPVYPGEKIAVTLT
jgi:acyl dehydratase